MLATSTGISSGAASRPRAICAAGGLSPRRWWTGCASAMRPAAACEPIYKIWVIRAQPWSPAGSSMRKAATGCGRTVIVVEGLFDLASLWQAGFTEAVALLGSHFNARQQAQLCDGRPRTVYLCLDADENGSGPRAARLWSRRLEQTGVRLLPVELPGGYDPNRFFAEGGSAAQFSRYLEQAGR